MVLRGEKLPGDRRRDNRRLEDRRREDRRSGDRRRADRSGPPGKGEESGYGRFRSLPEAFKETLILQRNLLLLGIHEASVPFWISIHIGLSAGFLLFLNLHIAVAILFSPDMTVWPFFPASP